MSFWSGVTSAVGGLKSVLSAAGVSSSNLPSVLSSIAGLVNPGEAQEITLCKQILLVSTQPDLVAKLADQLALTAGIPAAVIPLAQKLKTAGVDVAATVLEIEQIIQAS
jgi:hypothetical protein